jgi:hypothetical protein
MQCSFTDASYLLFSLLKNNDLVKAQKNLPDLQKKEQKLRSMIQGVASRGELNAERLKMLRSTLQDISNQFFDLVFEAYTSVRSKKLEAVLAQRFSCRVVNPDKKAANPSFHNALLLLKNVKGSDDEKLCLGIIQHYLGEETYPFKKPGEAYPWSLAQNKAWLSRHKKEWQEPFAQEYYLAPETNGGANTEERTRHHLEDAQHIITQLNITAILEENNIALDALSINDVNTVYRTLSQHTDKYDALLLKDLKTQQNALNSLVGQQKTTGAKKITVESEFDPLEVLQMGNYVQGSCLNVNDSNKWSAIVNAVEANKRVLWARDERGNVIGRLLIAVDNNDRIVRFRVYYATHLLLDNYFNDYIRKLAERCGLRLNGKANSVENLVATHWYKDPEATIDA